MFKLYGFCVSNYYNMVKLALLEKGLPFEEVMFVPTQTPESLAISPRAVSYTHLTLPTNREV